MQYKRYDYFVIGAAICFLLAVAGINYSVDPGNIFSKNVLVKTCGQWLLEGHTVAITKNYDERLLQKYLIENDDKGYEVAVFGSSRAMDIGANIFVHETVKNYSVSGASIEDDIALYFLYERLHGKPQKVVIGGDAWLLNANSGQSRWKSVAQEYEYGKGRIEKNGTILGDGRFDWGKYMQLISWPYLKESVRQAKKSWGENNKPEYYLADDKSRVALNAGIICPDGTHLPSAEAQAGDAEPLARKYISGNIYSLEKYEELDDDIQDRFRSFLTYLRGQNIDVVLYLPPYHPIVYSYLAQNEKYRNAVKAESFFRDVGAEYGLTIVGSYDPQRCGLSNADFLDGMHMRPEAVVRIIKGQL